MNVRKSQDHYLPSLDGWRAIAILMVVASHAFTNKSEHSGDIVNLLSFRLGTFGVMLFFAISGYLICTRLLTRNDTLRSFYIRRVFRILPPAYFYLLIGAALGVPWRDIAPAALFYSNYLAPREWLTGHFWSLAIEEHFYLLWPPILMWLGKKRAIWAGAVLIVVTVLMRQSFQGGDLPGYTHLRLDSFMFPCLLAILLSEARLADRFRALMTPPVWCLSIVILAAGIIAGMLLPWLREPQRLLQSFLLPVIIVTTVLRPKDWIATLLNTPILEWIGRTSYSIYLWQQFVFAPAFQSWGTPLIRVPLELSLLFLLATLSKRWIEQPAIALGKRLAATAAGLPALR